MLRSLLVCVALLPNVAAFGLTSYGAMCTPSRTALSSCVLPRTAVIAMAKAEAKAEPEAKEEVAEETPEEIAAREAEEAKAKAEAEKKKAEEEAAKKAAEEKAAREAAIKARAIEKASEIVLTAGTEFGYTREAYVKDFFMPQALACEDKLDALVELKLELFDQIGVVTPLIERGDAKCVAMVKGLDELQTALIGKLEKPTADMLPEVITLKSKGGASGQAFIPAGRVKNGCFGSD